MLHFEFSRIDTRSKDSTFQGFLENVKDGIVEFISQYGQITDSEKLNILSSKAPNTMLMKLFRAYRKSNIYILLLMNTIILPMKFWPLTLIVLKPLSAKMALLENSM